MPNARQAAWSILLDATEEALAAQRKAEQEIEKIEASEMYADDYKRKLIDNQRSALESTARELLARATVARDTLLDAAQELDAPTGDTTEQLLAETRQQRAWARLKPQLDAGVHWSQALDRATAARDGHALVALAAELPSWLQAATAGTDAQLDVNQLRRALDVATFRALGDDQGPGTAARLRLHVATRFPIAQQVIEQAALGRDLTRALSIEYAKRDAADTEAELGEPPAGGGEGAVTREQFQLMTGAQRNELFQTNPGLYQEVSGRTA